MLGIRDKRRVYKLVRAVRLRWEVCTDLEKLPVVRGRLVAMLDLVVQEAWSLYARADDRRAKIDLLHLVRKTTTDLAALHGITPEIMQRFALRPETPSFLKAAIARQERLVEMVVEFNQAVRQVRAEGPVM